MITEEIVKQEQTTPDQLLALAVNNNLDIDKLEKLLAMKERWEKGLAEKSFTKALADFQDECPELRKTKPVRYKEGGPIIYHYAPLADIDRQIKKLLRKHGFTKTWKIFDSNGKIKVICSLKHTDGHTEETEMESESDMSGGKNAIQAKGSAIEYMKRYTLIGVLGLTTADTDIDGATPEISIDILHKQYMEHYNQLIQINPSYSKWHPDNWKSDPTAKVYVKAIGEIRKELSKVTPKDA